MKDTIDQHLDAVLRAAGSGLRYYSMQKTLDDMRAAMQTAMLAVPDDAAGGVARMAHLRASPKGRVYIAGPMTGLPEFNFPAFHAKAAELRKLGWHVENPAEHGHVDGAEWADYLRYDLARMVTCSDIYLLKGWAYSRGARCEARTAMDLGLNFQYEPGAEQAAPPFASGPLQAVLQELERATRKFPTWPTDPLHALAVLGEEFGELTKDMLQLTYEPHKTNADNVRTEALQTAAMALRLYMSLDQYQYRPGEQHSQAASAKKTEVQHV